MSELKWVKLRSIDQSSVAKHFIDWTIDKANQGNLFVDSIIWDKHDSRHTVRHRDDIENLHRMYFHLLKHCMRNRGIENSQWEIRPDENSAIDWDTVKNFLIRADTSIILGDGNLLTDFIIYVKKHFSIVSLEPCCSRDSIVIQLADLFCGFSVFSHESFGRFSAWQKISRGTLFSLGNFAFSKNDVNRFTLMEHLDQECKKHKMGVSLRSEKGFYTYNPRNPLNFWLYKPQHSADKAPTKSAIH